MSAPFLQSASSTATSVVDLFSAFYFLLKRFDQGNSTQLLLTLIDFGLYGFFCVQVYTYYMMFQDDRSALKFLVYGCFVIETLQTLLLAMDGFGVLVTNKGEPFPLDQPRIYLLSITVLNAIVTTAAQLLCAYRLRVVLRSRIIPVSIIFLSMCAGVSQIITGARIYSSGSITTIFNDGLESALVYFISNIICDIVIMGCIIRYLLYPHPVSNTSPRYQLILKHPIRLLVETGSFIGKPSLDYIYIYFYPPYEQTAISQFVGFILYFFPVGLLIPYAMMSTLYSNILLLMLNNRSIIPGGHNDMQPDILAQS